MENLVFLDPVIALKKGATLAPRPETLDGATVGFLWNHRQGGERMLELVEKRLREKYELKGTLHRQKHYIAEVASKEILKELNSECDVVVTALGD